MFLKSVFILLLSFYSICGFTQSFEGRIELEQTTVTGLRCKVTWFIKPNQVAYQIESLDSQNKDVMRMVPLEASNDVLVVMNDQKRKMRVEELSYRLPYDLSDFKKHSLGVSRSNSEAPLALWQFSTKGANVEAQMREDIDVDLSRWEKVVQGDFALLLVAKASIKGFPVSYKVKDNSGNLISESKLLSVSEEPLSDIYFN